MKGAGVINSVVTPRSGLEKVTPVLKAAAFSGLFLLGYLVSRQNYLISHTAIELISIVIAWSILMIAVSTHPYSQNSLFLFLGIAYAFVGGLDLLHTLAYEGMEVFQIAEGSANLATQLWIVARFTEAISILLIAAHVKKVIPYNKIIPLYVTVLIVILLSIFSWQNFPACYIQDTGLTAFKVASEYIIIGLIVTALTLMHINRKTFQDRQVYRKLFLAYSATIAAELLFTLYSDVYGAVNFAGHCLKLLSFYYIYEALIKSNLHLPYRKLAQINAHLQEVIEGRQEAEAKRLRYEQELSKLSKLNSLATLAGGLAHDFKNLLTIIHGNCSLARMHTDDEKLLNTLDHIESAAAQGTELTNRLLSFTRDGAPRRKHTDVGSLVQETVQTALSGSNVEASISIPKDSILTAEADSSQIRQVINNIAINAVQAMPRGGSLDIVLERKWLDDQVTPLPPGNYFAITFKDQGEGISEVNLERIFDPFFTTKENGHGLGLATCYAIIKKHGGYISATSEIGAGTTFTVFLPAPEANAYSLESAAALDKD